MVRKWFIECWHSGDTDQGHAYTYDALSAVGAVRQLLKDLSREGVVEASVGYIQVQASETSAHTLRRS